MFLPGVQKHFCFPDTNFASETYVSQFSHHLETMLICFQCRSHSKNTIKMADCEEIEAAHVQKIGKGRERNWKDEEIEMLITLYEERPCPWDVGHKDSMNRDNLYLGLSFGFLHLRRPNKLLSPHKVVIFFGVCWLNAMF